MQKIIMDTSDQALQKVLGAELETSAVIDAKMQEAYEMIREGGGIKRKTVWRKVFISLGSTAAVLCAAFIFCVMNPVLAREIPILGSIFGKIADVYSFGELPEEGTVKLPVEDDSNVLEEDSIFTDDGISSAESSLVSTDGGITISIMEEYASNQALYIGVKVENEQVFPEMVATIDSGQQFIKARTVETYSFAQEPCRDRRYIEGKFVDEHTFLGVIRIDYGYIRAMTEERDTDIPESFTMDMEITEIASTLKDAQLPEEFALSDEEYEQMTEEERAEYTNSIPKAWYGLEYQSWHQAGVWQFTLPIRLTDENARTIEVDQYGDDGTGVESIEISTIEIRINTVIPEGMSLYTVVFDAAGRQIENTNSSNSGFARLIEGHDISTVSVYFCDLSAYFELEEAHDGAEVSEEEVAEIAQYQVVVPISE